MLFHWGNVTNISGATIILDNISKILVMITKMQATKSFLKLARWPKWSQTLVIRNEVQKPQNRAKMAQNPQKTGPICGICGLMEGRTYISPPILRKCYPYLLCHHYFGWQTQIIGHGHKILVTVIKITVTTFSGVTEITWLEFSKNFENSNNCFLAWPTIWWLWPIFLWLWPISLTSQNIGHGHRNNGHSHSVTQISWSRYQ